MTTLQRAAERTLNGEVSASPNGALRSDLRRLTDQVASALEGPHANGGPSQNRDTDPALLQRLRASVVELWQEDPSLLDPGEALSLLDAFDSVRDDLRPPAESRPGIPSSLELIVELAHDLRSPLTSILFLTDALRGEQSGEINSLQRQQLGIIYSAALGLVSMAGDVIEYAREGHLVPHGRPAPFSISQLLDSVRDMVQPMTEARGIALRISRPEQDQLMGYPTPLSRVLLNLTTNAVKATEKGYVLVSVSQVESDQVEFSVADTGSGLDPDMEQSLFDPFRTKQEGSRTGFSGMGLGLDICRRLVAAMGGTLEYETTRGEGTRFYFSLGMPSVTRSS